ncbi:hypothetical protein CL618_03065 [archaeon]|nr:hypothetical protein [archaeon]|tara:strand:- start:2618 stop:2980 length:363 start_codon:yes stop_codon:yes gene_type:complete
MKTILLDTNFLLAIYQFKLDIFQEIQNIADFSYEIQTIDRVIDELNTITGKDKKAANYALKIIKEKHLKILKTEKGHTDDILVKLNNKAIIATQDKELKKRLKNYITIRQKKYLIIKNVL